MFGPVATDDAILARAKELADGSRANLTSYDARSAIAALAEMKKCWKATRGDPALALERLGPWPESGVCSCGARCESEEAWARHLLMREHYLADNGVTQEQVDEARALLQTGLGAQLDWTAPASSVALQFGYEFVDRERELEARSEARAGVDYAAAAKAVRGWADANGPFKAEVATYAERGSQLGSFGLKAAGAWISFERHLGATNFSLLGSGEWDKDRVDATSARMGRWAMEEFAYLTKHGFKLQDGEVSEVVLFGIGPTRDERGAELLDELRRLFPEAVAKSGAVDALGGDAR